jgi:septin family protein
MKSAYERAMERFGQEKITKLSDEQKQKLAELEKLYQAKIAERELLLKAQKEKAAQANDPEAYYQIDAQLVSERQRLQEELEEKKEEVRKGAAQ